MLNRIKNNKKGISQVISLSIFILLVFVSVGILWSSIKPLTLNLSPQFNCQQLQLEPVRPLTINKACFNSGTNNVELTITRSALTNIEFNTIDFTITLSNRENLNYYCGADCGNARILGPGETMTYFFGIGSDAEFQDITVGINNCPLALEKIEKTCQ